MSKLAQWMEITASAGVIIGIVFLIIEISQNTTATENEAVFALQSAISESVQISATNDELFNVMSKIYENKELSSREAFRGAIYFASTMPLFEYAYSQYEAGLISEALLKSYEDDILLFTNATDFSKSFWKNNRNSLTENFRNYVDGLIAAQQ